MDTGFRNNIRKLLLRHSLYSENVNEDVIDFLLNRCKVLVVGAGGLGCELLKDLALMGIRDIHIIDMDTIELSNLNRQFLFRKRDIGKPKAEVAAQFIKNLIPDVNVVPHYKKIQDLDASFYNQFNIVVCGLDSIEARRWINNMMMNLVTCDQDGNVDQSSVIPLIDGGTEGLKGSARVILPGITACIECNLDLYPPPVRYPLCTLANTPRLPEHCIEYVKEVLWFREKPFGISANFDPDDEKHISWAHEKAILRAEEYGIDKFSLKFTQGVLKRIIPAVSTTNACVAATCAIEAFKLITSPSSVMNNYQVLNLSDGVYTYVFEAERKEDCLVCGKIGRSVTSVECEKEVR